MASFFIILTSLHSLNFIISTAICSMSFLLLYLSYHLDSLHDHYDSPHFHPDSSNFLDSRTPTPRISTQIPHIPILISRVSIALPTFPPLFSAVSLFRSPIPHFGF